MTGNNRIVTGTGSAGLNAEAGLTYDGSTLAVTGAVTVSTDVTIQDDFNIRFRRCCLIFW